MSDGRPRAGLRSSAVVLAALLAASASGWIARAQEDQSVEWEPHHWTRMNGLESGNSATWEGAAIGGDGNVLSVWCDRRRDVVGYQIEFDQTKLTSEPAGYRIVTLSLGGQLFDLPIEHKWDVIGIPGVPYEKHWNGQGEFLRRLVSSRIIEIVSLTNTATGETVYINGAIQALGCGAGLERVVALCGKGERVSSAFCDAVFCPGNTPILEHFNRLVDAEPDQTFFRPKAEIKQNAEEASTLLGDEGVYGFAEGICFAPNGIANQ